MQQPSARIALSVDGGEAGGEYELTLGYASGGTAHLGLLVNGTHQLTLLPPATGGWGTYKAVKLTVSLKPGENKMEIRNQGRSGANLDYIDLKAE
jgi:hypothetical protein